VGETTKTGKPVVGSVIVTYNRVNVLKNSVAAVLNQTRRPDFTVIVDNNSSDATQAWISQLAASDESVVPIFLDRNYGGAGGFHYGLKKAYERGADWIWMLDDDSVPAADALEILLANLAIMQQDGSSEIGYLCSEVNWTDGTRHRMNIPGPAFEWTRNHPRVKDSFEIMAATFVSTLINRKAVKAVGYPVKEFFIWFDDVEYTLRISDAHFLNYYIRDSKVTHDTPDNETGATYKNITPQNVWKFQIGSRNRVAYQAGKSFGLVRGLREIASIYKKMNENKTPTKLKMLILLHAGKGFFFN